MKRAMIAVTALAVWATFVIAPAAQEPPMPGPPPAELRPPHDTPPRPTVPSQHEGRPMRRPRRPDPAADAQIRDLLQQVMVARISQDLALNDEQTVIMVRRFSEFREQLREMMRHRAELIQGLDRMLREGAEGPVLEERIGAINGLDMEIAHARIRIFEQTGEGLTPTQRAKLYLFISDFEAEMRALIQQARDYKRMRDEAAPPHLPGDPEAGRPPIMPPQPPNRPNPNAPKPKNP